MNLGLDTLRELLEDFLSDSGGRRGRERERRRRDGASAGVGADVDEPGPDGPGEDGSDAAAPADESSSTNDPETGTTGTNDRPDADDVEDEELVDDLYYRIESLEDELESNDSRLGTIQDSQEQVAGQVQEVNDTVRQLLGVYDRLTDDVNPFTGEGEGESGFGVFGTEDEERAESGPGVGAPTAGPDPVPGADGETVSFADLKDAIEDAAEAKAAEAEPSGGKRITFDEDEDDTRVEVQPTDSVDDDPADDEDEGDVTLETLADTFATDVIVFEWLTELVRTAGPAAALRAISYYHEIGWIEDDVKEHLESVLSGPDLDIHVDPGSAPDELTAADHADSYTYIMKLNAIHETKRETET